jgi:hypothetical protein
LILFVGVFFREYGTNPTGSYESKYFDVYPSNYDLYNTVMAFMSVVTGIVFSLAIIPVIEYFTPRNDLALPWILIGSAVFDCICVMGVYAQQSSFTISLLCDILYGPIGYTIPCYLIMLTILDDNLANYSYSLFTIISNQADVFGAENIADSVQANIGSDPGADYHKLGKLVVLYTIIPTIISIPFFYVAGLGYRQIKHKKIKDGNILQDHEENLKILVNGNKQPFMIMRYYNTLQSDDDSSHRSSSNSVKENNDMRQLSFKRKNRSPSMPKKTLINQNDYI